MRSRLARFVPLVSLALLIVAASPVSAQEETEPAPSTPTDPMPAVVPSDAQSDEQDITPEKLAANLPQRETSAVAETEVVLEVWNRKIVEFRAALTGVGPTERAAQARARILNISHDLLTEEVWHEPANIRGISLILIGVKGNVLLALTDADLDPTSDQTVEELAEVVVGRIQEVFRARAEQHHWPNVLKGLGLALLATLVLLLLLRAIVRLRTILHQRLIRYFTDRALSVSGFDLRPHFRSAVRRGIRLFSWALILPLAYVWLTFVLRRFAYTRPWGDNLRESLFDLLSELSIGALSAIPGLFTVFLIFLFTRFLTRLVGAFFLSVENEVLEVHWLQPETAKATRRLVIVIMWIFALTVAYPYIPGSSSAAFRGVSVFVGLMVSLGATGMVNQIVSGMVIVYTRAFRPGEFVRIGETEGFVEEIGVLSTKVSTLRREHITIPNAVLINTSVNNYSRDAAEQGAVISTSVTIGYDVPWRQVHALLTLAAERCARIRKEPAPRVMQKGLSDFYVEYTLLVNIDDPSQRYVISSELHGHIQDAFNEHGVQILSPHYLDKAEEAVVVPKQGWSPPPADPDAV